MVVMGVGRGRRVEGREEGEESVLEDNLAGEPKLFPAISQDLDSNRITSEYPPCLVLDPYLSSCRNR